VGRSANEIIAKGEPWKLAKAGDDRGLDAVFGTPVKL